MNQERIDEALDAVLRASGSRLSHYTMPSVIAAMREAMRQAMTDTARMDWLEDDDRCYWVEVQSQPSGEMIYAGSGKGLRGAIDHACGNVK